MASGTKDDASYLQEGVSDLFYLSTEPSPAAPHKIFLRCLLEVRDIIFGYLDELQIGK